MKRPGPVKCAPSSPLLAAVLTEIRRDQRRRTKAARKLAARKLAAQITAMAARVARVFGGLR